MLAAHQSKPLRGATILIVEDEAIVALDLALTVEDEGGAVAGPLHRLEQALAFDALETVDAAILDVDIADCEVFTFARRLRDEAVPIVFHTGRPDVGHLSAEFPSARVVRKPASPPQIVGALSRALAGPSERSPKMAQAAAR